VENPTLPYRNIHTSSLVVSSEPSIVPKHKREGEDIAHYHMGRHCLPTGEWDLRMFFVSSGPCRYINTAAVNGQCSSSFCEHACHRVYLKVLPTNPRIPVATIVLYCKSLHFMHRSKSRSRRLIVSDHTIDVHARVHCIHTYAIIHQQHIIPGKQRILDRSAHVRPERMCAISDLFFLGIRSP
jgi:hypothetical protein